MWWAGSLKKEKHGGEGSNRLCPVPHKVKTGTDPRFPKGLWGGHSLTERGVEETGVELETWEVCLSFKQLVFCFVLK